MQEGAIVLLVEDDESDAIFFQRAVQKNGFPYRVHVAGNGKEAMEYIQGLGEFSDRTRYPFPKFIITDNRMPVMTGNEFLKWLRAHPEFSVVPTIILGGSEQDSEIDFAYEELRVHSYIVKPSDVNKLQDVVKRIFDYWSVCRLPTCKQEKNSP
ncbi:MAG: response regulator [Limisphaerales bacterium]